MPAFRLKTSLTVATLGIALGILIQPGAAFAYTQEEQQACTPDAMRLCGEFVPNVDAITACMIKKKSQLSPQCAVFFRRGPQAGEPRAGRPTHIAPHAVKKSTKPAPKATKKKKSEAS